jgi:hypothetical protein
MKVTFKKLMIVGLLVMMPLVFSGCLLRLLFGFAVTSDIGDFVDIAIDGDTNIALCFEEDADDGTFVSCTWQASTTTSVWGSNARVPTPWS